MGQVVFARFKRTFLGLFVTLGVLVPAGWAQGISFVQVSYSTPSTPQTSVSVTYTHAQAAGDTNVIAIGWDDSTATVTSVTDSKGNTYSLAVGPTVLAGVESQVIYVASNIAAAAAGGNTVTVNFSPAAEFPDVRALEYRGLDPVSPVDDTAAASGNSLTSSSGVVTTTNAYDLIFAANYVTTSTDTAGSGFVNRVITNPDGNIAQDQIVKSTGNYNGAAQLSSSGAWIMQTVALRAAGPAPSSDPSVVGQWSAIAGWPILPIHVSLLPNGKVLAWGHDASNNTTLGTVWDPSSNNFQTTSFGGADLFCAGQGLLPDGRVFVAGGHNMADYFGLTNATAFDSSSSSWSSLAPMTYARWYPTVTALPDGRMLVTSGAINCDGCNATVPEVYDPASNSWSKLTGASLSIPIYPHMFVLPDGRVINTGSYELPIPTRALNISTQTWTTIDPTVLDAGSAVMYRPGKILKTGTSATSEPPYITSAPNAYVLDMTQSNPAWRSVSAMAFGRTYHNSTVLPDGNVLITGGEGTTNPTDVSSAANAAEMWSPATENFTTMASMQTPRVYHSTALLLPDGRVLVGGSGEYGSGSIDQLSAEIYSPPYLFKGTRPTVTSAPASLNYGSQFTVQTPSAANIASVALIRLGSVTHAFNENQRYVPLTFTASSGSLSVTAPANGNIAPPGHYMLFLVNNSGSPSVAKITQLISSGTTNPAPTVASISPNSGSANGGTAVTITGTGFLAGATATVGGTAATGVTVVSSTSITATTAAHSAGAVSVGVTNTDGQSGSLSGGYTYTAVNPAPTVSSIAPNSGSANGGTAVTITGTGFLAGATVKLGGTTATGVTLVSSTSIRATSAAHAAGAVSVVVTNTDSQTGTLNNGYTYTGVNPAPTVTSITPTSGSANGGTAVTIKGTGFLSGATVKLGGTAATGVTIANSTTITATTAAHAAGAVSVVVTNSDGQGGTLTNGYTYTAVIPAPSVSSISPASGTVSGGTAVSIAGSGFLTGATVKLGGTAATGVSVVSGTSIAATTPAHAAGTVSVVVTNTDSQTDTLANGYTYNSNTGNPSLGLGLPTGESGTQSVNAGQTASYTLSLGGAGMSGAATVTCTGAPQGSTCSVPTPQNVSSTVPADFTVTVTTTSRTIGALHVPGSSPAPWSWTLAASMLGVVFLPGVRLSGVRRSAAKRYLWFAPLTLLLLLLASCGGGGSIGGGGGPQPNPNGTPAGTYTLVVNAASGSAAQSASLTLIVK